MQEETTDVNAPAALAFHFLAGLSTGVISASLLQPADLLKTRVQQSGSASLVQTLRHIVDGPNALRELWRGTLPSVIRTGFGSALYFSTLNGLRQQVARSNIVTSSGLVAGPSGVSKSASSSLPRLSNIANLTSGAIARASVGFIMMPITVIKVRYESNLYSYKSIWQAAKSILEREGMKGFFSGFGATALRDAPYAGLYILFYEQSKRQLSQPQNVVPPVELQTRMASSQAIPINFLSGVVAAGLATTITNPFDAVKTRLQLMPQKYGNMFKATRRMIAEDGFPSLFDGLGLRVARKALSSALVWTLYEEVIRHMEAKWEENAIAIA
jgi:solute carrier family 25 protein 38